MLVSQLRLLRRAPGEISTTESTTMNIYIYAWLYCEAAMPVNGTFFYSYRIPTTLH